MVALERPFSRAHPRAREPPELALFPMTRHHPVREDSTSETRIPLSSVRRRRAAFEVFSAIPHPSVKRSKPPSSPPPSAVAVAEASVCDNVFDVSVRDPSHVKRVWSTSNRRDDDDIDGPESHSRLVAGLEVQSAGPTIERAMTSRKTCVGIARSHAGTRALELIAARRVDAETVRVSTYRLDERLLNDLLTARVESLAESASLTGRERQVLELMLLGRSARDIAAALRISHSTAKFHQTNVLDKLGAESRFDLFRLLG